MKKKLSSYQRLKQRVKNAEEKAEFAVEELEAIILYPYSSRARDIRLRIKIENDLI